MRLSAYPYVVVRIRCRNCPRAGSYKLARLAEKFGAEIEIAELVMKLSADCPNRSIKRHKGEHPRCGAHLPDVAGLPEPEPPPAVPPAPALRVVGGGRDRS